MYILGEGKKTQKKAITRSNTELQASTKKIKYQTAYRDIPCVAESVDLQHLQECKELMEGKAAQQHRYIARKYGNGQLMVVWGVLLDNISLHGTDRNTYKTWSTNWCI